jgi:tRNA-Thr(GGU) m(6)t(6)A37 methyltransferase TsaA
MTKSYTVHPIGIVHKKDGKTWVKLFDEYSDGLLGLDGFSHIYVLYWFHENDSPEKRQTLQVHPRKDPQNPLTGVFATHSPRRPNLIALTLCKIKAIIGNRIQIDDIDAFDETPVIDIKCYIPDSVPGDGVRLPDWVKE